MAPNIHHLKELILLFRNELIEQTNQIQDHSVTINKRDPITPWERGEAYSWIFLETDYETFRISSEQIMRSPHLAYPEALLKPAEKYYSKWGMKTIKTAYGCPATTISIKEIHKYKTYGIPQPTPEESLIAYIKRLEELCTEETYSKKTWKESLACFLEYIKTNISTDCVGFIDSIFPEDRTLYDGKIIRLVPKKKFSTNIIFVADILKNLSQEFLQGDPRAQHSAAETLAFALLCLTSARLRLPTEIKLLYEFDYLSLHSEEPLQPSPFSKRYFLKVPTLFGAVPAEISKTHFNYFFILSQINRQAGIKNRFFKVSERCLGETFNKAVSKLKLPPKHGEITLSTLTSWPHEVMHHRTQIDNKRYKAKTKSP